jgi:hypothetical protein
MALLKSLRACSDSSGDEMIFNLIIMIKIFMNLIVELTKGIAFTLKNDWVTNHKFMHFLIVWYVIR